MTAANSILLVGDKRNGKTLAAVKMARDALREGRPVATNVNLFPEMLLGPLSKAHIYRLPDFPRSSDLEALPPGNPNIVDEDRNGLLILDECAGFLNSREWQGNDRTKMIAWLAQAAKCGWNVIAIVHDINMIDAQIRRGLTEVVGFARRLDKVAVPFIGGLVKWFTGKRLMMPKLHVVTFYYGMGLKAPMHDKMVFLGSDIWRGYDTAQKINPELGNTALYSVLPPYYTKGRYMSVKDLYAKAWIAFAIVGFVLGFVVGSLNLSGGGDKPAEVLEVIDKSAKVQGVIMGGFVPQVVLSDGQVKPAMQAKADQFGERYLVDGKWFEVQK